MDEHASAVARQFLAVRAARFDRFRNAIFDEHAWDILLHLFVARAEHRAVALAELPELIGAPEAVANRWVDALAADASVRRVADGGDVRIVLSDDAAERMTQTLRAGPTPSA